MRRLCGAIIAAGALISLGLFSVRFATRVAEQNAEGHVWENFWVTLVQIDTLVVLLLLIAALVLGLAMAFAGLARRQYRRHLDMVRDHIQAN
jgi:hypothetical protein